MSAVIGDLLVEAPGRVRTRRPPHTRLVFFREVCRLPSFTPSRASRLDTLFLALPISWRGTLVQYAGRLHRLHDQKKEVIVYDYADLAVPMLARMHERRLRGYRAIGYEMESAPGD